MNILAETDEKKRIAAINTVSYGSTGTIMRQLLKSAQTFGFQTYGYFGIGDDMPDLKRIGAPRINRFYSKLSHITGLMGCFAFLQTHKLIKELRKNKIHVIHLHNLHISFINYGLLFKYIKKDNIRVIWTFHDCWAFTGHCPHFDMIGCPKWMNGCYSCPQYKEYPISSFDNSRVMWKLKRKWFTGVEDLTIVTPSQWLANLVKQSFLQEYPVKVIHNGIDLFVFKPTPSDFRQKYKIPEDKFILLGVAFGWGVRKGLDVFIELAKRLPQDQYQIILVGTDENTDKQLPENIISIHRTQNQQELAEIYTAADLFVNPTREDTFPTVNMESLACGTPVLTFNSGGSPEVIDDTCGCVVEKDDVDAMERKIIRIMYAKPYSSESCFRQAMKFDHKQNMSQYIKLYEDFQNE